MTLVVATCTGLLLGLARVGRAHAPGSLTPPRWWPLVLIGAGVQVGISAVARHVGPGVLGAGLVTTNALVGVFLVANCLVRSPQRWAFVSASLGWVLNALVVGRNGGMPVSARAAQAAGFQGGLDVSRGHLYEHVPLTKATALRSLADVIPVPSGALREVISIGDIFIAIGIALAIWQWSIAWAVRREVYS